MTTSHEETTVAILGAGVSGLTLALLLRRSGVPCVVLERRSRAYVQTRQRAGVVDARNVRMFERWGLADTLLGGPVAQTIDYRLNGVSRVFTIAADGGAEGRFCTQQMLVTKLLEQLIDVLGGDVRFEVEGVALENDEGSRPRVRYADGNGTHEIVCDHLVGCDAERGVSRRSIPDGVITTHSYDFGYAWLAALVEAPLTGHPMMAVSDHGFVGQLPRGPQRSRYYLQCPLTDGPEDWPAERLWSEIRLRLGDPSVVNAKVLETSFVPLRSVVHAPMQYRNLYLVGDAAHLLPPVSAKGMNLALFDADVLAGAIVRAVKEGDRAALAAYSETCLPQVWKYQKLGVWMADTMHDAGDPTQHGTFRQGLARARLDLLFTSETAAKMHSELQRGMI